jgi:cytochrome bd ubiquinol oxidase subunit I
MHWLAGLLPVAASTVTPQPVPTNLFSNSTAVAIVALVHIQIATFITGGSFLLVISEAISMVRGDERHERLTHTVLTGMVWTFGFGSALAILWITWILLGMWGTFFIALARITFWPFIFEAGLFITEIVLLYTIYANWGRLRAYRRTRLGLLVLLAVALWWQQFFIDIVASYMLTPNGGDTSMLAQVLNPTNLPLDVHRTVGNVAWAGSIIATIAAVRFLIARRRERGGGETVRVSDPPNVRSVGAMSATWYTRAEPAEAAHTAAASETAFWDWAGMWGAVWAVGATLFQPWLGYSYAKEIQLHAYPAWYRMMFGDLSNVFLVQIFLLGMIFVLGTLYFWRRMRASEARGTRTQVLMLIVLVLATLLAAMPARFSNTYPEVAAAGQLQPWWDGGLLNPIGTMIPNKIIALLAMVVCGLVSVTGLLRAHSRGQLRWGDATRRSQWLLVGMGLTVSAMMIVMGIIREHSRQPFVINGEMTIQGQQVVNTQPQLNQPNQENP